MKMYPFPESKVTVLFKFLLMFSMIMLARDGLVMTALLDFSIAYALSILVLLIAGLIFLMHNRKQLKQIVFDMRMLIAVICTLLFAIPMVVKKDWQIMYFSILLGIYVSVFLSFFMTMKEAGKYYTVILVLLAGYSIVAHYIMKPLALNCVINPSVFVNSINMPFYNFGFSYVPTLDTWYRNNGVFREPGVYQFFIIIGMYFNNYTISWNKEWKIWVVNGILAATMISTYSTNGIVELGLLVVVLFFGQKLYKNRYVRLGAIAIAVASVAICVYSIATHTLLYSFMDRVFAKLFSATNSMTARVESVVVDLNFFLRHPIFGDRVSTVLHAVTDNTTSTMIMFAILGISGGLLHLAGWIALVWDRKRSTLINLSLLLIMLMSFNTQNLTWDILFWLFPMMALIEKAVPWLECKISCRK